MLPIERQKHIRDLIQKKKTLKISELSEYLQVSEMTVYRDIKPLIEEGLIEKTFGGVSLVEKREGIDTTRCVYCQKPYNDKWAYRLFLPKDKVETACCAHCGLLRHRQLGDDVVQAICQDFFVHTTTSAPLTWFVMETSLNVTCCQPHVLPFAEREHAEKFVKGFGGHVYEFRKAMDVVYEKMRGGQSESRCEHHVN